MEAWDRYPEPEEAKDRGKFITHRLNAFIRQEENRQQSIIAQAEAEREKLRRSQPKGKDEKWPPRWVLDDPKIDRRLQRTKLSQIMNFILTELTPYEESIRLEALCPRKSVRHKDLTEDHPEPDPEPIEGYPDIAQLRARQEDRWFDLRREGLVPPRMRRHLVLFTMDYAKALKKRINGSILQKTLQGLCRVGVIWDMGGRRGTGAGDRRFTPSGHGSSSSRRRGAPGGGNRPSSRIPPIGRPS
ncbi:MAG: hypothetical protein WBV23_00875 [Desulfobaccales bacterium]